MAHVTYHTDAFVLGGFNTGESHRFLELLTKEVGFVRATVRSVRVERSKLRYSLQDFSKVHISLVQGKDVWRVTGAEQYYSAYTLLTNNRESIVLLNRITTLIKRLVQGEERNDYLFQTVDRVFGALAERDFSKEEHQGLECIAVLRILYSLGYLGEERIFEELFQDTTFEQPLLLRGFHMRKQAIREINRSLQESQL